MEGSGLLPTAGSSTTQAECEYGYGTCFSAVDPDTHRSGVAPGSARSMPFKSVAVDPRFIKIGEPVYVPEFDGILLPDGERHDGCVRADDTGGGIKKKKMDFFVMTYANFRFLSTSCRVIWITPHQDPRCEYMRDPG
jgi:3D (Asp-Asp-Asp) domain-containing protein